jgi:UPF0271 protein
LVPIDLNADIGEGCGDDAALLACVSSASIACGGHAGDETSMRAALRQCLALGVAAGAHPSYPDREHFGRRALDLSPQQVLETVLAQTRSLQALAEQEGLRLRHLKPHGALYNRAADDALLAEALASAAQLTGLALMGLAGSELVAAGRRLGLTVIEEAFADRGYAADARLLPRGQPGALLQSPEQAQAQLLDLVLRGGLHAADGRWLRLRADSVCLHGDTPGALAMARALRAGLAQAGVEVRA